MIYSCFFHLDFAGGCAEERHAGGGTGMSAVDTSVELEDPLVNPSVSR